MSKLSIYESGWINIVFEDRNQEYGAYQLRRDCVKSSSIALFSGFLLVALISLLTKLDWGTHSNLKSETLTPTIIDTELHVIRINNPHRISTILPQVQSETPEIPIDRDNFKNPVVVSSSEILPDISENRDITNPANGTSAGSETVSGVTNSISNNGNENYKSTVDENAILKSSSLDKLPEFPGGISKFYSYVGTNFEKPEIDGHDSIQLIVNFIIEKDGSMTAIHVKNDPGYGIGTEAIRVLMSLKTKWLPGVVNSKKVRTAFSLPITILLE